MSFTLSSSYFFEKESECESVDDLRHVECVPYAVKQKLKIFFLMMNDMLECQPESIESHGFCQVSYRIFSIKRQLSFKRPSPTNVHPKIRKIL